MPKKHAKKESSKGNKKSINNAPELVFPLRINKYLAYTGKSTRTGADDLIKKGLIFINGTRAVLGDIVQQSDVVDIKYRVAPSYVYVAYNKPTGVNTLKESGEDRHIMTEIPEELKSYKLFPIGRLDKESTGLIILTNDGRITNRLLNPEFEHEKTYEVKTKLELRDNFKSRMESGVEIEGYATRPARIHILGPKTFRITLTEGKTHQVRRMVVSQFNEVVSLKRTSIMNIQLGGLAPGEARILAGAEKKEFLTSLGLG